MKCRLCGDHTTLELARLKGVPKAAQWMPNECEIDTDLPIELVICQCKDCGLVQLSNEPVSYYKDVITTQSLNKVARSALRDELLPLIAEIDTENLTALEIGCGNGGYLHVLQELGFSTTGIEHCEANVESARSDGLNVRRGYLTDYDRSELLSIGKFSLVVVNNFLEHQPDVKLFLSCTYDLLQEKGFLYVSVPSLERIEEKDCLQEFISDHLVYFTEETLRNALSSSGFEVSRFYEKNNGNDLVAVAKKRTLKCYQNMERNFLQVSTSVANFVSQKSRDGHTIAVWGAGHRALTFMAVSELQDVAFVIDSAKFKQGRLTPLLHRRIIAPEEIAALGISLIILMLPGALNHTVSKLLTAELDFQGEVYCFDDNRLSPQED